jgi:hypothetical protein
MRKWTQWVLALATVSVLAACGGPPGPPDAPRPRTRFRLATGATCPPGSTLTWDSFAQGFFASYCTRCHGSAVVGIDRNGAPVGYDWDDPAIVRMHLPIIETAAAAGPDAINVFMPALTPPEPTDAERDQLGEWLACGAP